MNKNKEAILENQTDRQKSDFIEKHQNPYCYQENGYTIELRFKGECTLEDCIASYLKKKYGIGSKSDS